MIKAKSSPLLSAWRATNVLRAVWLHIAACMLALSSLSLANREVSAADPSSDASARHAAIKRSIVWLASEVPKWIKEHDCAACHHQGDATRALLLAQHQGLDIAAGSLESSLEWCLHPDRWQHNRGDPQASDFNLAKLQFADTLQTAYSLSQIAPRISVRPNVHPSTVDQPVARAALTSAARLLLEIQLPDGSWKVDDVGDLGSPITQGPILLTGTAACALQLVDEAKFQQASDRAWRWLCDRRPKNVFEAASQLWSLHRVSTARSGKSTTRRWPEESQPARLACRQLIVSVHRANELGPGAAPTGLGYGPYVTAVPQNFDTALVLLALLADDATEHVDRIGAAARYLVGQQQPDGTWNETTRMSDVESYAHRTSTTAWATQALLMVDAKTSEP